MKMRENALKKGKMRRNMSVFLSKNEETDKNILWIIQ